MTRLDDLDLERWLDTELILACAITPANRPEGEGVVALEMTYGI